MLEAVGEVFPESQIPSGVPSTFNRNTRSLSDTSLQCDAGAKMLKAIYAQESKGTAREKLGLCWRNSFP